MNFIKTNLIKLLFIFLVLESCSSSRLNDKIIIDKNEVYEDGRLLSNSPVNFIITTQSNKKFLGIPFGKILYESSSSNTTDKFDLWINKKENRRKNLERVISNKQIIALNNYTSKFNEWLRKTGEPPAFLKKNEIEISKKRVVQYYKNLGYYDVNVSIDSKKIKEKKIILKYKIEPNQKYLIESITAEIESPQLKTLYDDNIKNQLIIKGEPFEINKFEKERERLFLLFKNNGIYNFQQNSIQFTAAIDSSGNDLNIPVKIKIENIKQRLNDSLIGIPYKKYKIEEVLVFIDDSKNDFTKFTDSINYKDFKIYSKGKLKFKPKSITSGINVKKGKLYSDEDRNLTFRYFNNLKNFKYPSINYKLSPNKESLIASIYLNPKERFSLGFDLDLSHSNIQDFGFGIGGGLGVRNLFSGTEILELNLKNTLGASRDIAQSDDQFFNLFELGADLKLTVPRILVPFTKKELVPSIMSPKTQIILGTTLQENIGLDKQFFTGSYQFDWEPKNEKKIQFKLIELEFVNNRNLTNYFNVYRNSYDRLNKIAKEYNGKTEILNENGDLLIPNGTSDFINDVLNNETILTIDDEDYKTINTIKERYDRLTANNLILGSSFNVNLNSQKSIFDENFYQLRWKVEWIGNLINQFLKLTNSNKNNLGQNILGGVSPSQYIKTELDYIKHWSFGRERVLAFHAFTGFAIPYGNSNNIPFSRSYFSGGANDNRAWKAYKLGPGSSNNINDFNEANFKLAFNLEYRFAITGSLKGGLFIDLGNIWNLWDDVESDDIKFNGLEDLSEIAIGSGFGIRYDFDFFVFRFDTGFKTYNPSLEINDRWWSEYNFKNAVFNIGINYPF